MDYLWRGRRTPSVERHALAVGGQVRARSTVEDGAERDDDEATLDADRTFRTLRVRSHDDRHLDPRRGADGAWSVDETFRPDLAEAVDTDADGLVIDYPGLLSRDRPIGKPAR